MSRSGVPTGVCAALFCCAAWTCRGAEADTVLFEKDFEAGLGAGWQVRAEGGGRVEVVREGEKNRACEITSRGGDAWLVRALPGQGLAGRTLQITCRYRLSDFVRGKARYAGAKVSLSWKDRNYDKTRYGGGGLRPVETSGAWTDFRATVHLSRSVHEAEIRIGFQRSRGTLVIDDLRLTTEPQVFVPVEGVRRAKRGRLIFGDEFDGDLANWVHEGVGTAIVEDGRLFVSVTEDPSEKRGQILWYRQPLPADVLIEMLVTVVSPRPDEYKPANLLFYLSTTRQGGDLLGTVSERDGLYGHYISKKGIIPCYTVTWYRLNDPYFLIARRNPGWGELERQFAPVPAPNEPYRLEIEKVGGRILFVENGVPSLLVVDPEPPLAGGYFGLRSWHATASYDCVRVYEIEGARPPGVR